MNQVAVPETRSPREEVVQILAEGLFAMIVHRLEPARWGGQRRKTVVRDVESRRGPTESTRRSRR